MKIRLIKIINIVSTIGYPITSGKSLSSVVPGPGFDSGSTDNLLE